MADRVKKSIINAEVNLLFYFLGLFFAFFSRKIFLNCLGTEFIGLTGTLSNILGYLNLAELGVGSCISFFLFKPLQENDREKIQEILSLFGYLYLWIGRIILAAGILISLCFPFIFESTELSFSLIYFAFYSFLGSSLIGYFINYRQILLTADQKNYLVAIYFQSAGLVKTGLQILLAYQFSNLYLWVAIEFIFGIIGCLILNWKINKEYPWLKTNKKMGKGLLKKYPEVLKNTRQIFIHQIKDFVLSKSDELLIFVFVSLKMVAYYGNYTMVITKVAVLFRTTIGAIGAGVGNLVAEGNKANIMKVFWEIQAVQHAVAGFICFAMYELIEPFITLWLGGQYVMDHAILVLLLVYTYMSNSRSGVDMYNHAYGLYADVWSAWVELIINIGITLICGYFYGITGILLGKIVSVFIIVVFWKPYYLFRSGVQRPYSEYWRGNIIYIIIFVGSFALTHLMAHNLPIIPTESYLQWILYATIVTITYLLIYTTAMYFFAKGTKDIMARIRYRILKR